MDLVYRSSIGNMILKGYKKRVKRKSEEIEGISGP